MCYFLREMKFRTTVKALHTQQDAHYQEIDNDSCWQRLGERESSYMVADVANVYGYYGKHYGGSSKNLSQNYLLIQQSHFWENI